MNIFISWSGEKGKRVAFALKTFLQDVNQRIIAWFSDTDISAGERWAMELATQLESTDYGIICVTQESLESPWIIFESGALSTSVKGSKVCPYLIDLNRRQLSGPLSQFQAKEANKEQTWQMLQSINRSMEIEALAEERLRKYFDTFWPDLETELSEINRELQPLPKALRQKLMETLPPIFYDPQTIQIYSSDADLPIWRIDWNQAAIRVWYEVIQLAANEKKLEALLDVLIQSYPGNHLIQELHKEVHEWQNSFDKGD